MHPRTAAHRPPRVSEDAAEIARLVEHLKLPPTMRIREPENLEGDWFWWYFQFSKGSDVEKAIEVLQAAVDGGHLARMLRTLSDAAPDQGD